MIFRLYQPQAINELGSRQNQEDTIFPAAGKATAADRLFIVCDGMGGYEHGEVASATVSAAMARYISQHYDETTPLADATLHAALSAAYDDLDAADQQTVNKMGTTLTLLCLHRGGCVAAHIGDSRIYHLRPATGEVLYRSRDHSLVQQLYELGEIGYHDMKTSPQKNIVMRAMQPHQDTRAGAELVHITDVRPGDYFYLCTDGMLEQMEDDELMAIVSDKTTTDEQKRQLLVSRTAGNADNHSAYLVHVERVESEESDSLQPNDEPQARAANKALNDPDRLAPAASAAPTVTIASQGAAKATAKGTKATAQPTRKRPAKRQPQPRKEQGGKKYLIPVVVVLVAILTGATLFNLSGRKKEAPATTTPATADDPERIEFRKDNPKEETGTTTFPTRKAKTGTNALDKQTEEVNSLLENQERRQQQRTSEEKATQEQQERQQAEEAQQKARQAKQQAAEAEQQTAERAAAKTATQNANATQQEQLKEGRFTNGKLQVEPTDGQ